MTVTAPPRPRALPEADLPPDPEALIEEARRRARRRRLRYLAAGVLAAGAGAAAFFGFNGGSGSTRVAAGGDGSVSVGRLPRSGSAPARAANGLLAVPAGNNGEGAVYALDGGLGQPIFECKASRHCYELESAAWSPDGRKLAFSVTSFALPDYGYDGIHVLDLATRKDVEVGPSALDLAWSADGTRLAAVDNRGIFVVGSDGSDQLLFQGTRHGDYSPTWSPSGSVAFARRGHGSTIWTVDRPGGRPRVLADGAWPAWSPDGTRIAYRSDCGIRFVTPSGRDVTPASRQVTFSTRHPRWCEGIGVAGAPAWSPDGTQLAIATMAKNGRASVYIVNADGSNLHRAALAVPSLAERVHIRPAWQAKRP